MRRRKLRTFEELYAVTKQISGQKITPVLKGGKHIQGPVDESDCDTQRNMGLSGNKNVLVSQFPRCKFHEKAESGKCTVCSSPCLSCVNFNQSLAPTGSESNNISDGVNLRKAVCSCSSNVSVLFSPSKAITSVSRHHTSSETSNIISGSSSHDSENEESKDSLRIYDPCEGTVMLSKGAAGKIFAADEPQIFRGKRIFSSQHEKQKVLEFNGDDISCISGDDSPGRTAGDKSNPSEISSLRDVCAGASSSKGVLPEGSMEQVESSSARVENISLDKYTTLDSAESVRPQVVNCSGHNESLLSVEVFNGQGPPVQSHQVDCNDGSDLLVDVRVCDICGDAGREELLAVCSKCCDGAEHIYCMNVRLEKLPEGDWICEECMLKEETEKPNQKKFEKVVGTSKGSSLNSTHRKSEVSSSSNSKACLEIDTRRPNVDKSRRDEVSSVPYFSNKRRAGQTESSSETKRRALETSDGSHKAFVHSRIAPPSRDSLFKNVDKTSFVDHSSKGVPGNAQLSTISGLKSQNCQSHPMASRGILTKSNSFHISAPKLKGQSREEGYLQNRKFPKESATGEKIKDGTLRMMSKSLSFNNASSGSSNATDAKTKMLSAKISHVEDLKRSRQVKEPDSIQKKHKRELNNSLPSSPITGSSVSASEKDNKSAHQRETILPHFFGSKHGDPMAVQRHADSNNSSKSTSHLVQEGSKSSDHVGMSLPFFFPTATGILKRLPSCLSNVSGAAKSPPIADLSREQTTNVAVLKGNMGNVAESFQIISPQNPICDARRKEVGQSNKVDRWPKFCNQSDGWRILAVPVVDVIWKGGFEIQNSKRLPNICFGIQAHLSTCASPKVPEVVKKFPGKVVLEEVPRLTTWPTQFMENHPKEDSIGLYFFAEDLESYRRNYKSLVEYMINYDLALRGNFDGIELLIFSSKVLPETSQCWNKLFFLWGVFRGRRVDNTENMPTSLKNKCLSTLNDVSLDRDLSMATMPRSQIMNSSWNSSEQPCGNTQHTNTLQKEHGVPERVNKENTPRLQASHNCDMKPVISTSGGSYKMEVAEDSMINISNDPMKSELLGLGLSLEAGKNSETLELLPLSLGAVSEKKNKGKNPNSLKSEENNDDYSDEHSGLLELSLALPSYDK